MDPRAKLTDEQVRQIQQRKGSARALAAEFKVSHTTILNIRRGERQPDTSDRYVPKERHVTPVGTVITARLVKPMEFITAHQVTSPRGYQVPQYIERRTRFTIRIELSEADASPLIARIEEAVRERVKREYERDEGFDEYEGVEDSGYRPYKKLQTGNVHFDFRSKPGFTATTARGVRTGQSKTSISLTNAAGNRLRKPERIKKGSLVRVTFELFTWVYYGPSETDQNAFLSDHHVGVGITLGLQGVELVKA